VLAVGIPIEFGTDLGRSFRQYDGSYPLDIPTDDLIGGHAMLLVGYLNDEVAIGVNSHGTNWGRGGFFTITRGYLEHWRTRDLWALDLPDL
jgi:C1A family cysteine protease